MSQHQIQEHQEVIDLINSLRTDLTNYVNLDMAWKVRAEPVVKAFENTSWLWKLFIGTLKVLGLIGSAGAVIYAAKGILSKHL